MTDNGPYTRESYSLEPMKETMRTIGFKAAHKVPEEANDNYQMMDMATAVNDEAQADAMEGGEQLDDESNEF